MPRTSRNHKDQALVRGSTCKIFSPKIECHKSICYTFMLPIGGIFPPFFDLPPTYLRKGEEAKKENDTFFPIYECQRPKNDLVHYKALCST